MKANELLKELEDKQEELAEELPETMEHFQGLVDNIMVDGALPKKQKLLIALGIALAKKCKYCIVVNLEKAINLGVSKEEILEVCSVVMLLDGGPGMAYSTFVIKTYEELIGE